MNRRGAALRRYPAFGFVALAVALASTLPTALTLPQDAPGELAELAPVPPEDEPPSDQHGDLAAFGEAGSGGLGAGSGGAGDPPPPPPPPPPPATEVGDPGQRELALKRCVGDPPRQTEDPLSPPCVAFFDGDNGGATAPGVTGQQVVVVAVSTGPDAGQWRDLSGAPGDAEGGHHRFLRVLAHYVNERYQTWGRQVRVFHYEVENQMSPEQVAAHAIAIEEGPPGVGRPFAVFLATNHQVNGQRQLLARTARSGILSVSYDGGDRADHAAAAPLFISFQPDMQDIAAAMASYTCDRLAGRAPRHAGPATRDRAERRFGLYVSADDTDPEITLLAQRFEDGVRAGCDLEMALVRTVDDNSQHPANMTAMRAEGVTTIVPVLRYNYRTQFTSAVGAQVGWEPEIFVPGLAGFIDDGWLGSNYNANAWRYAFGVSYDYRRGSLAEQPAAVAMRDACPGCPYTPSAIGARTYDTFMLLARAIQAAGPELTPQRAEAGLRAIPPHRSDDPAAPAAYFTAGNWSFVKDGVELWWDPTGQAPGRTRPDGCYRLVRGGQRFRSGEWPEGDDGPFGTDGSDQPCQGWLSPGAGQ